MSDIDPLVAEEDNDYDETTKSKREYIYKEHGYYPLNRVDTEKRLTKALRLIGRMFENGQRKNS